MLVCTLLSSCILGTNVGFLIIPGAANLHKSASQLSQIIASLGGTEERFKSKEKQPIPGNETYFWFPDEHNKNENLFPRLWLKVDDQSNTIALVFNQSIRPFTPYAKDKLRELYRSLSTSFSNDHMCITSGIKQLRKLDIVDLPPECTKGQSRS